MGTNGNESRGDEPLVAALGRGMSYTEAAAAAGCSRGTVARRMAEPEFRSRVVERRQEAAEESASLIEGVSVRAAERLSALVDADNEFVALKAALAVLDRAEQYRQARATGDRLEKLEGLVAELVDGRRGLRGVA